VSYKLTKKAQADLSTLVDLSLERFGPSTALYGGQQRYKFHGRPPMTVTSRVILARSSVPID
jgi:hypothetical protein